MAIRVVEDVGAPVVVSLVNIMTRTGMPEWHDTIVYAMTALGYAADFFRFGGDFTKMIGVSSLPLTIDKLYERFKGVPVTGRVGYRSAGRVARYPAPAQQAPFQSARLV